MFIILIFIRIIGVTIIMIMINLPIIFTAVNHNCPLISAINRTAIHRKINWKLDLFRSKQNTEILRRQCILLRSPVHPASQGHAKPNPSCTATSDLKRFLTVVTAWQTRQSAGTMRVTSSFLSSSFSSSSYTVTSLPKFTYMSDVANISLVCLGNSVGCASSLESLEFY